VLNKKGNLHTKMGHFMRDSLNKINTMAKEFWKTDSLIMGLGTWVSERAMAHRYGLMAKSIEADGHKICLMEKADISLPVRSQNMQRIR
jgi:hypothetical protein